MNNRITKKSVLDALTMSIWRRRSEKGLVFHSDRGSQYCSNAFQKELKKHGMLSSMSRKGDCWEREAYPWGTTVLLSPFLAR